MGTVATGMSACIATMAVTSVYGQRGMTESTAAKIDVAMWAGLGAGIAVGILTWLVVRQPRSALKVATAPLPDGAITFDLGPDDRLAWAGYAPVSNVMRALFGIIMVVMGSLALVFLYYGQKSLTALMLVLMLLVGLSLLFLLFAACSPVTIDTRGVRVIALGVIRWVDIPLSNIEGASVTMVSPLGDFGGWGKRVAFDGSQEGFVTIEGPAIRVTRAGERPCLISVNDAETAAATLNTLVKRRREGYPRS